MEKLKEMARVGVIANRFDVVVFTDDMGKIPHVHIIDKNKTDDDLDCCIKLETNEYFVHSNYYDKLNAKMRKAFDEFMRSPSRNVHYRNNYEQAINLWNDNNSDTYIQLKEDEDGNIIQPNYKEIL